MKDQENNHGKTHLSWHFPEYIKHERGMSWYVVATIVSLAFVALAMWTNNFLFAAIVVMTFIIILLYNIRNPRRLTFQITEDGIDLEGKFYPYKIIKAFWIIYEPPEVKTLYFHFKGLKPRLSVPLGGEDPVKVREVLLQYAEEDKEQENESFGDVIERRLKL